MDHFFWCRECEAKFLSHSTHDEFLQAQCPSCNSPCMGFEFELKEEERTVAAESASGSVLSVGIFALFGWLGLMVLPNPKELVAPKIFQHRDDSIQRPAVLRTKDHGEAKVQLRSLVHAGIAATCETIEDEFGLRYMVVVDQRDKAKALRLIGG